MDVHIQTAFLNINFVDFGMNIIIHNIQGFLIPQKNYMGVHFHTLFCLLEFV